MVNISGKNAAILGFLGVILAAVIGLAGFLLGGEARAVQISINATGTAEVMHTLTAAAQLTLAAQSSQTATVDDPSSPSVNPDATLTPTSSPSATPTNTKPPTSTPQPTDTPTPTLTVEPTDTPTPTVTPPPTDTPAPTPTPTPAISLPFVDQFVPGIRSEWEVLEGEPVTSQGRLTPGEGPAIVLLLNDGFADITVEFDYHLTRIWNVIDDPPQIVVTLDNMVRFGLDSDRDEPSRWQRYSDGRWRNTAGGSGDVPLEGRVRIVFSGNVYETYVNGQLYAQASFGDPVSGPLQIRIVPGAWIADFEIRGP